MHVPSAWHVHACPERAEHGKGSLYSEIALPENLPDSEMLPLSRIFTPASRLPCAVGGSSAGWIFLLQFA